MADCRAVSHWAASTPPLRILRSPQHFAHKCCQLSQPLPRSRNPVREDLLTACKSTGFGGWKVSGHRSRGSHSRRAVVANQELPAQQPGFEEELQKLLGLLPDKIRETVNENAERESLVEIVLDLGRRPTARFPGGDVALAEEPVSAADIEAAISNVGEFGGDNRAGIDRTLHRVSAIRSRTGRIVGLTCRVGRSIAGSAEMVRDLVASGASILLMGPPGVGKTTAIREISRMLAEEYGKRVVIVDTSNEIGGDGDIPHPGIGQARRMQVPKPELQHQIMIEAVENHMPQVIVIDEIGTELETMAAGTIAQRGVQLVGTAHGQTVENLVKNPSLCNLAGGIESVTLGDEEARRRGVQKSVLERKGPPTFTAAVEMISRTEWRIHRSLAATVDNLLLGRPPLVEVRQLNGKPAENPAIAISTPVTPPATILDTPAYPPPVLPLSKAPEAASSVKEVENGSPEEDELFEDLRGSSPGQESDDEDYYLSDEEAQAVGAGYISGGKKKGRGSGWKGAGSEREAVGARERAKERGKLLLFAFEVAEGALEQVLEAMELQEQVVLTNDIGAADVVLALRNKLKHNSWVRGMARFRHLPIYAIKANTVPQMVRALRAIMDMDTASSAGSVVAAAKELASWQPELALQRSGGQDGEARVLGDSVPLVVPARAWQTPQPRGGKTAEDEIDALEEARLAVEQIVIPKGQPVELLPRSVDILALQVKLVEGYQLTTRTVGDGSNVRLRILPEYTVKGVTGG